MKIKKILKNTVFSSIYKLLLKTYFYFRFLGDFFKFIRLNDLRFSVKWHDRYPQLLDKTINTGFDAHYIYHPAWAARILANNKPSKHIDISSTLNFCSILSAFIPTEFYDYRPAILNLSNLKSASANLSNLNFADNSIKSLSCMHTVEHVGLGRYGDRLDSAGDLKAIKELKRVVAIDGDLLFVVPIGGIAKIQFNAHRIYTYDQILNYFSGFKLIDFSLVTDEGSFINNANKSQSDQQTYGCGCFWFKKYD